MPDRIALPSLPSLPSLPALTSLRFCAAALVLSLHYFRFEAGFAGVSFFFVLSGFILTYTYSSRIRTHEDRVRFWWKRFARVYPTHLLTLCAAIPLTLHSNLNHGIWTLLANLTLLQSWSPVQSVYFSFNGVAWSISTEAFFYSCFPFLLVFFDNKALGVVWRSTGIAAMIILCMAIFWMCEFPKKDPAYISSYYLFYIMPATRMLDFLFGIALGLTFLRLPRRAVGIPSELAAIALTIGTLSLLTYANLPWALSSSLICLPVSGAMVFVFAHRGPIARLMSTRPLVILGEASFALYMIHQLPFRYGESKFGGVGSPRVLAAYTVISVVSSVFMWFLFEKRTQAMVLNFVRVRIPTQSSRR